MTKITASLFMALDGVVDDPAAWHFPYFNEEMGAAVDANQGVADIMVFGRKTYDSFAGAWPERELAGEEDAYGHRKLGGIGALTGELLKERTGEPVLYQQVAYLMRSGAPDSLDLMVATNYAVMAADLAGQPSPGLRVQLCGDAHLSNFGFYASPERDLVFDLNDFDETLPGPWEWDVKRLAASFVVAGRAQRFHAAHDPGAP